MYLISALLPWPVSTNNLWRVVKGRNILSARYRKWIAEAQASLVIQRVRPVKGRITVSIKLHPPDRRSYDPDNKIKAVLDLLVNMHLIDGDSASVVKRIQVESFEHDNSQSGALVEILGVTDG